MMPTPGCARSAGAALLTRVGDALQVFRASPVCLAMRASIRGDADRAVERTDLHHGAAPHRDNEVTLRQSTVEDVVVSDEYVGGVLASEVRNRGIVPLLDELLTAR